MDKKKLIRFVLVYVLLIPVMMLLTAALWGGVHGALGGKIIGRNFQDPKILNEVTEFTKKYGLSESASKEEIKSWFEKLSPKDKAEFQKLVMQSFKIEDVITFDSIFIICLTVFVIIGLISGLLTKTWLLAGIFPVISFLLNNPISRFPSILSLTLEQKIIMVFIGQFLASYIFAYIGAKLAIKMAQKNRTK